MQQQQSEYIKCDKNLLLQMLAKFDSVCTEMKQMKEDIQEIKQQMAELIRSSSTPPSFEAKTKRKNDIACDQVPTTLKKQKPDSEQ